MKTIKKNATYSKNAIPTKRKTKATMAALSLTFLAVLGVSLPSQQAYADIGATHTSLVSEFASFNTPGVIDGRVEAIAIDGDTVFVGGTFTQIQDPLGGDIIDQSYLFAYSKSTGNIIREFDPVLDNVVLALETTGEGSGVFAGGIFARINGEGNRRGLVKIDNNGDRTGGFSARANATVKTLVRLDDTLYVGGNFSEITNVPVEHLAAIDTATGTVRPTIDLDFDGAFSTATINGVQGVDDIDITTDGELMVVVGNFASIDGISRSRLAVIELDGQARVSNWNTDVFDVQCPSNRFPQYILGMDIAPDNSYFVTGSTGFRILGNPACDTTARYDITDLTNPDVKPTWVNYTGGDSVYEVVSTDHAIYIGGHFEFLDNDFGNGNVGGPGSTQRAGLAALDPLNGLTVRNWQSDRTPRGLGTFALIAEDEGLYIGDDTDFLNGTEHQKLKFLPVSGNTISRPELPTLPTTILNPAGNALTSTTFNGVALGAQTNVLNTGWQDARGGMMVGGTLFNVNDNGSLWSTPFSNGVPGNRVAVDLFGITENEWALSRLSGMFFDYEWSRVYYTLENDSRLFYRAFSPDSRFFSRDGFVAEQQGDIPWGDISGMDVIDGNLYFGRSDGSLYRAQINGASVVTGTTQQISGPGIDGRNWNNELIAFTGEGEAIGPMAVAEIQFESSGSQTNGRFRTFEFEVTPGEPVDIRLEWQDPTAMLNLFVRDANNILVASDNTAVGSPKRVMAPAGAGGTYVASVLVKEGSTAYNLQINPREAAPAPLADFEFNSSGDQASGRFQSFDFDVVAGEMIEAQVSWDALVADTEVRLFLRDENGNLVTRNTNNISPAPVSVTAETSGQWSVAVLVRSGAANYEVLVDTIGDNPAPVLPPLVPIITNIAQDGVASQSSTAFSGAAARAIDGNTDGTYRNRSVTHTASNSIQAWWEVALTEVSTIDEIVVFNRTDDCCTSRLSNYTVSILDANGQTVFSQFFSETPNPSNIVNVGNVVGTTVRVQLAGANPLSLAEVQVFGYGNSALMQ